MMIHHWLHLLFLLGDRPSEFVILSRPASRARLPQVDPVAVALERLEQVMVAVADAVAVVVAVDLVLPLHLTPILRTVILSLVLW